MTKHQEREKCLQLLFSLEFHERSEYDEQIALFKPIHMPEEDEAYNRVVDKVRKILEVQGELDMVISANSTGWPLERLGKNELNILRIAIYEIKMDEEVPNSVAINEAVELAKAYGNEQAGSFINGVLAKLVK